MSSQNRLNYRLKRLHSLRMHASARARVAVKVREIRDEPLSIVVRHALTATLLLSAVLLLIRP
jgi:hypothetical protein